MPKIKVDMPLDVRKHVLRFQAEKNTENLSNKFSQQRAIYAIIREHAEFTKPKNSIK